MSYPNGPQPGGEQPQWGQPQTGGHPAQPQGQPAPQQWGQPAPQSGQQTWGQSMGQMSGSAGGFNVSAVRPGQWVGLVFWVVAIIAASLPFVSVSGYGYSSSASGWNSTNVVFMFIFALIAAAAAAVEAFVPSVKLPIPMAFVTGGALALAGVFGLLAFLTNLDAIDYFGVGAWIVLVAGLIALAGGVLEIMHGLKQPKTPAGGGGQWGAGGGGQWGQPAQAPQQQWGQPGQPGQPGQQQWGQPGQ